MAHTLAPLCAPLIWGNASSKHIVAPMGLSCAMPQGSPTLRADEQPHESVEIPPDASYVILHCEVQDTGIGIAPERAALLFKEVVSIA